MAKAAKKKSSRKHTAKAGDGRDERLALAFRNLEPEICDCVRMAGIAMQLHMNEDEAATFAIDHVYEMLRRFKQEYYAAYHGDPDAIGRHAMIEDNDDDG